MRERGFEWLKEQIDKEYADILENGGIATPEMVPEGFGGYQSQASAARAGRAAAGREHERPRATPEFDRWLESNVEEQQQTGYAMVTVRIDQGNLTSEQMRALAKIAREAGDGCLRVTVEQNLRARLRAARRFCRACMRRWKRSTSARPGARELQDVVTCPGAYSCNLALTKSMNLGCGDARSVRGYDDPAVRALQINISGCPNSCGQHWTAEIGFYGNARKIEWRRKKEVPYYQLLLGGGYDEQGVMRFGLQVQSMPARLATVAVERILDALHGEPHAKARRSAITCCASRSNSSAAYWRISRSPPTPIPRSTKTGATIPTTSRCSSAAASARRNSG